VLWGALSGVTGAAAISLLFASLAIGPMSILSPLTAVVSAVVPMTVGLLGGDRLAPIGYWGLGLALVAVVLVGFVPEKGAVRPTAKGIVMAIGSGAMIGAFIILIDQTPEDSGLVPLVFNRAVNGTIMFTVVGVLAVLAARKRALARGRATASLGSADAGGTGVIPVTTNPTSNVTRNSASPRMRSESGVLRTGILIAVLSGLIDVVANALFLIGLRLGDLSIMSVLTAMYPAGTILLAAVVLKERIAPVQWLGLALAVAAAAMLAVA
jgi:drug/metabolite transporter (DMT)-like permease